MTITLGIQIIFYAALALIAYTYVGYPAVVFVLSRLFGMPVKRAEITPSVSLIIAAHNEENDIAAKLENALVLNYPKEKLEIIVVSDCSTDRTNEIVRSYADRGVKLYRQERHFGKTCAQNAAVRISSGDILLFSDATTMYQPNVVRKLVRSFADPTVGCVAGQLIYVDRASTVVGDGCRSYWGYEKLIKQSESDLCSLIGVSGCLYAVRRSCHTKLANDMIDDFVIATEMRLQGLRTVYDPQAIAVEDTNHRGGDEFRMRVRVIEQTLSALHRYRAVLSLRRYGLYAFQMWSHKVMRYAVPGWLVVLAATNVLLLDVHEGYRLWLSAQLAGYALALVGRLADKCNVGIGPLAMPYYFLLANLAVPAALFKFMRGDSRVVWESARNRNETPLTTEA